MKDGISLKWKAKDLFFKYKITLNNTLIKWLLKNTQAQSPVHTETFSCVFVLFEVMSWLFSIPSRTINNTKTQGNVSVQAF